MALSLTVVSRTLVAPDVSFADHVTASVDFGTGTGRAVLLFGAMSSADASGGHARPGWARVGSTSGSGGTLMSKDAAQANVSGGFNYSRLFYLDSAAVDAAGAGLTGTKEAWMAATLSDDATLDGNRKPGFLCLVVQSSDGRDLTVGDLAQAQVVVSGSSAATQSAGSPSADAVGIVLVHSDGFTLGTATSPATLLSTGWTNASDNLIEQVQKAGTGSALTIGWQPGSNNQNQARHVLSLTAPAGSPTLSSPAGNATGNTTATVGFTTDQAVSGALPAYFLTLPAATAAPANEAALIADGATVSQTTGGTTPTRNLTGLTAGTAYRTHMCQPGSNVVSSASYTPSALSAAGSIATQGGVQGDTFAWTGALPNTFFSGGIGAKTIACTGLGASGLTVVNTTTGVLGGTQGTPGTYNLTFTQTDSSTAGTNPNGGGSPPQTATRTATLVITATGSEPTVNTNPTNLTVADGATASFTGSFDGSPIPSLQWQEFIGGAWTAMSGEVANVLALGVVDMLDTGRIFRIAGTNVNGGPIYSSSATLTVTGTAVGTITSDVFADWADDTPLASLNIPFTVLLAVVDGSTALMLTNQVTDTAGRLTVSDAALTTGDDYVMVNFNADGSITAAKTYTAT